MSDFITDYIKSLDNEFASLASDGTINDIRGFIDTGSFVFNALLSTSLYGGIPEGKVIALAGEQATGKCVRGNEKITIYCDKQTKEEIMKKI